MGSDAPTIPACGTERAPPSLRGAGGPRFGKHSTACALAGGLIFAGALGATAWIQDDAYITLRCVHNWVANGELTWNPGYRVQVYTHPLWMFLLSLGYSITRNGYLTALVLAGSLSLATWWLVARRVATSSAGVAFAAAGFVLSKAFLDYSTSGLENPLSHFLIVLFVVRLFHHAGRPRELMGLIFIASLLVLARNDLAVLIAAPLLAAEIGARPLRSSLFEIAIGCLPVVAWSLFAILYFGTVVPSPAHAKVVSLSFSRAVLLEQGARYLWAVIRTDPLTPALILSGVIVGLLGRDRRSRWLAVGIVTYLLYVVWVGGDFMSGRFLTVPWIASVCIVLRAPALASWSRGTWILAACLMLGAWRGLPNLIGGPRFERAEPIASGIYDCRGFYFQSTGLIGRRRRAHPEIDVERVDADGRDSPRLAVMSSVGLPGYRAGDRTTIVDDLALCDPLLSRLPPMNTGLFLPGHVLRHIPFGYLETYAFDSNRISDPSLAAYWDHLSEVIHGPLWSVKRMRSIWGMLTGEYAPLLEDYLRAAYRDELRRPTHVDELALAAGPGAHWFGEGVVRLEGGLLLQTGSIRASRIEVCLDARHEYQLAFVKGLLPLVEVTIPESAPGAGAGLRETVIPVPDEAIGFDAIAIDGHGGDGILTVGRIRLIP